MPFILPPCPVCRAVNEGVPVLSDEPSSWECPICLNGVAPDCYAFPCSHKFCVTCLFCLFASRLEQKRLDGNEFPEAFGENLIQQVRESNQALGDSNQELRASNQALGDSNQELRESNQELRDLNQELRESNQELRDSNQDLTDVTEELREANLDLTHANQELINANRGLRDLLREMSDANRKLGALDMELIDANQEHENTHR